MPQTLIEKIVQKHAVGLEPGHIVQSGDFISIQPAHIMTHDNTGAVMGKFKAIGANEMANPRQPVFTLDHNVQDISDENLKKYASIETFGKDMGVDFYPAGRGIGHQIMCEEGYAWPGTMAVASDSHSNMYGGMGCLGTPVVRTDAAALWATGQTWWQVPPITRIELIGKLKEGITGKDAEATLGKSNITVNKNTIPNDPESPFITSGLRIGTPASTTRGFKEKEVELVANWICDILANMEDETIKNQILDNVKGICSKFPVYVI